MDERLLEFAGSAGAPTTMVGSLLLLFFYLRKAEAGMRSEINGSLVRLQKEKVELQAAVDKLDAEVDTIRGERRIAEDARDVEKRRADAAEQRADRAEALLKRHGLVD